MSKKKKLPMEFRYYEIPQGERVITRFGEEWKRAYGVDEHGNKVYQNHFHNLMEVGFCREGSGTLTLDDHVEPYTSGTISVLPQNFPHATNAKEGTMSYWEYIFLDPRQIIAGIFPDNPLKQQEFLQLIQSRGQCFLTDTDDTMAVLFRQIIEKYRKKEPYFLDSVKVLLEGMMIEIALKASEKRGALPSETGGHMNQIPAALEYIDFHYMEDIKINELARIGHMSETHFRRLFEAYMNMTPVEYVNLIRIQKACEIMKRTVYSMERVAESVGYTTVSTFNRNFKKIVGISPYRWKREHFESKLLNANITAKKGW